MREASGARAGERPGLDPRRVAVARAGGEAVLFDLRTYRATRANAAAARAVALADGHRTVARIARALAGEFGVPVERARADLQRLLADLARRGFLRSGGRRAG